MRGGCMIQICSFSPQSSLQGQVEMELQGGDLEKLEPPPTSSALCCQPSWVDTNRSLGPGLDSPLRFWPTAGRSKTHAEQWWASFSQPRFTFSGCTATPAHAVNHIQVMDFAQRPALIHVISFCSWAFTHIINHTLNWVCNVEVRPISSSDLIHASSGEKVDSTTKGFKIYFHHLD